MDIWHKGFIYAQAALLLHFIGWVLFYPEVWLQYSVYFYAILMGSEMIWLRARSRINPNKELYRKSCFFGLLDLLSALMLMVIIFTDIWDIADYHPEWLTPLFLYIAVRKIYIMKNYSYEI